MATLSLPYSFTANTPAKASEVVANFAAITTFLNSTKINDDNIQSGGVGSASIASAAVTTAKINDLAVTTAKVNDLAVTEAKLAAGAVTADKIGTSAVTTSKLNDGAVTWAKLAARSTGASVSGGGVAVSSSSGTVSLGTSYAAVTNLSVTITTLGRPVRICLISAGTSSSPGLLIAANSSGNAAQMDLRIKRDSTDVAGFMVYGFTTGANEIDAPPSMIDFLDTPSAGTYTYTLEGKHPGLGGGSAQIVNAKLVAYEL